MVTRRPPRLWLVRHAQVLAAPGLCYGRSDLPADDRHTRAAAQALATRLQTEAGDAGLLDVRVSPLQRCAQLAQAVQRLCPRLSGQPDPRLRELDFGDWEGRPWDSIARHEFDAWMADFAHARPGKSGETVAELMARVGTAWDNWQASGRDAVWITHAGVMRATTLLARGVRLPTTASDWPDVALEFGGVLTLDGAGAWV